MTTITSAADRGKPNSSSGTRISSRTQIWTTCPVCGLSYKYGEEHVCIFSPVSTEYWTCPFCGMIIPKGERHVCGGRGALERIAQALEKLAK